MAKIRANYVFGATDTALDTVSGALSSPALARLPTVTSPDIATVILHDATAGTYEIGYVTAHTANATTATLLRAQEGTTARTWPSGTTWLHGLTVTDIGYTVRPYVLQQLTLTVGNFSLNTNSALANGTFAQLIDGTRGPGQYVGFTNTATGTAPKGFTYTFTAATRLDRLNLVTYYDTSDIYRQVLVEYTADGTTWSNVSAAADLTSSTYGATGKDFYFDGATATAVRVSSTGRSADNTFYPAEVTIYGRV